jgi:2-oxoisovalerate dehydrogenase E1 component beta subunit
MTPTGAGIRGSVYHSHSFDAWASRLAGWKVVMPSTPLDAYGLLLSAVKDPNPVMFLKPKSLLRIRGEELLPGEPENEKELKQRIDAPLGDRSKWKPNWPDLKDFEIPIGKAKITRSGDELTVVSYGRTLPLCQKIAEKLKSSHGASIEVIDLRSIYPYDWQTLKASIKKTGRVLFVNEDTEVTNFGEHLAYRATQDLFYELMARPRVLAGKNIPGIGLYPLMEEASVPYEHEIEKEILEILAEIP